MNNRSTTARTLLAAGTGIALALSTPLAAKEKPVEVKPLTVETVPAVMAPYQPAYDAAAPAADELTEEPYAVATDYGELHDPNPFAMLDKLVLKKPIVDLPAPDPARLAIANKIADALYGDGTTKRFMTAMRTDLFQPVFDRFWNMKASEAQQLFGMEDQPKSAKDETLGQALGGETDPYAKQRVEAYVTVFLELMGESGQAIEPDLRSAMARDFARRYTAPQLTEMAKFFATPTGAALGRDYWVNGFTLDILQTTLMNWSKMFQATPDFEARMKKAADHLPPAPKGSPFAKPDLSYLPVCAQDDDESDCTDADWAAWDDAGDAARAAGEAAMKAGEAAQDEAKLRAAWSKADLKAVEKAEAEYEKLSNQHADLDAAMMTAEGKTYDLIAKAKRNAGQPVDDHDNHEEPWEEAK